MITHRMWKLDNYPSFFKQIYSLFIAIADKEENTFNEANQKCKIHPQWDYPFSKTFYFVKVQTFEKYN